MKNIYYVKSNGYYVVAKQIHGERRYYGSYKSLEVAREVRDYLESRGWNVDPCSRYFMFDKSKGVKSRVARMFNVSLEELP